VHPIFDQETIAQGDYPACEIGYALIMRDDDDGYARPVQAIK
jgi:hypothetical protein